MAQLEEQLGKGVPIGSPVPLIRASVQLKHEKQEVPSQNNAAERSLRPCMIGRKISGGTRSVKGSATKVPLLSLFGPWQAQGQDALAARGRMLVPPVLSPVPVPAG